MDFTLIPSGDNPYNLQPLEYLFVEEFLNCFDGVQAARTLKIPHPTVYAAKNLKRPEILLAIREGLDNRLMGQQEILLRLANMARADIADFAHVEDLRDLADLRDQGIHTHVIKRFKRHTRSYKNGDVENTFEIEIHDPLRALKMVGDFHRMFTDYMKQLNVNLDDLSVSQLRRLAEGEDLIKVITSPNKDEENKGDV